MSDNKLIYRKMIARLYHNPNYGKAIGVKRKNQFVFNRSIELPDSAEKLFVDLANIDHAKVACQPSIYNDYIDVARQIAKSKNVDAYEMDRLFLGQLKIIHPVREFINGLLVYDAISTVGTISIFDEDGKPFLIDEFPILPCFGEKKGRSPDYFGANFDLTPLHIAETKPSAKTKEFLEKLGLE